MVLVREIVCHSEDSAEIIFSRLDWKIEKVDKLTNFFLNHSTIDTSRPWVGNVSREHKTFRITKTDPFLVPKIFTGKIFQLIIDGRIIQIGNETKVNLQFRLGLMSFLALVLNFLLIVLVLFAYYTVGETNEVVGIIFAFVFNVLLWILLLRQLNLTEKELLILLDV